MESTPPVHVVAHRFDRELARELGAFLREVGFRVVDAPIDGDLVVVVLLSQASVSSGVIDQFLATTVVERVIPVKIEDVRASALPDAVRSINWVHVDPGTGMAGFGAVASAILTRPEQMQVANELRAATRVWFASGQSRSALVTDHRRVREFRESFAAPSSNADPVERQKALAYLDASTRLVKRKRGWRRLRRAFGAMVVIGAVATFFEAVPTFRGIVGGQSASTLATFAASERVFPEWTGLLAATAVIDGVAEAREPSRYNIAAALQQPWRLGTIDVGEGFAMEDAVPIGPEEVVVLARGEDSSVVVGHDLSTGAWSPGFSLVGEFYSLDVNTETMTIVVGGPDGLVVLTNGTAGATAATVDTGEVGVVAVRIGRDRFLAVLEDQHVIEGVLDGASGPELDKRYEPDGELLHATIDEADTVHLLSAIDDVTYELTHGAGGERDTLVLDDGPLVQVGGVSLDGSTAFVSGPGRELWRFGEAGGGGTGIAIPHLSQAIAPLGRDLVVLAGAVEQARVVDASTAETFAQACVEVPDVRFVRTSRDGDQFICLSTRSNAVHRVEEPPLPINELLALSDDALIEQVRRRLPVCWGETQLQWTSPAVRTQLGIAVCPSLRQHLAGAN